MTHAYKPSVDSEMHELNAEADLLELKTTVVPGGANGEDTILQTHNTDPDAQAMVIESLRAQVQDLFSQVTQLNNKLVRSYDRVSDLEDELHVTSSNLRQATLKISQLELERTQHLSALSTGLLVEKSHVTTELTRLMEKATEEAARRGQAESARAEIEQELDDLSANLFNQANIMVAEARIAEARSARKLEETEVALRSAEEVVGALQAQMQALQAEKEQADRRVEDMRVRMGKGKWVDRSPDGPRAMQHQLLSSHVPYHEFLVFVSHLRAIRPASVQPPAMSTLLPLPLLARLVAEDSDPTVRLDLAPSLNWLSRRSVFAAIHSGQLTVEPMQFTTLLEELAPPNIPASSHHTHISCALCGMPIYSTSSDSPASTPTTPNGPRSASQSASWSTNLFKNVRAGELNLPTPFSRQSAQFGPPSAEPPSQLYIFRLDATTSGLPVSLPMSQQQSTPPRQSIYPLCTTGWCLARLRSTCSLWAFVRTSVVEKVWEEPPVAAPNVNDKPGVNGAEHKHDGPNGVVSDNKQPTMQAPPRKTKMGLGSLWGTMQRSLSGSPAPEAAKPKEDVRPKLPPRDPSRKTLPPPPPSHPADSRPSPSPSPAPTSAPVSATPGVPPPLPKRNRGRETRSATPEVEQKVQENGVSDVDMNPSSEPAKEEIPAEPVVSQDTTPEDPAVTPKPELTILPTTMSRATSNDSFATPTEELAPPLDVSVAAASVALPSSQESSPVAQDNAPSPDESNVSNDIPSAEATTAVSGIPSAPRDDAVSSRTGSPVPPPLPRRAAARARPTSILVPEEPAKTDGAGAAPPSEETAAPAPEQPSVSVPTSEAAEAPSQDANIIEEPIPVTAEPESLARAEAEEIPSADVQPPSETPAAAVGEEEPTKTEETPAAVAEESHLNGDVSLADAVSVSESNATAVIADPVAEEAKDERSQDNGQYVGDSTWEERTYKELVRLREEMFWARVGAAVH
ncbi:hypothetical protein K466DRAFT_552883 [Polyporus arcularius HHB13444]|uniref:GDP/GTP exchange factor Sec2 N-terminal domain-containing protein n=1 Tax=Polyporus arcularius HHB13444 TaxID=1314778 RepID=A0A5C3PG88_9APHY|nr:hypothetical protein K466DRAFT_552883 [Polyporus arcularius HHB13444]